MLASPPAIRREAGNTTYICLSCHLKRQFASRAAPSINRRRSSNLRNGPSRTSHDGRPEGPRWHLPQLAAKSSSRDGNGPRGKAVRQARQGAPLRSYHSSSRNPQHAATAPASDFSSTPPPGMPSSHEHTFLKTGGIRDQLRQWQELHGKDLDAKYKALEQANDPDSDESPNNLTRLPDPSASLKEQAYREEEEERAIAHFARTPGMDEESTSDNRFLKTGDLIELEFPGSEKESTIAVFVRRALVGSQVFTLQGRWQHLRERFVQYSIPGWVSPKLVEPLMKYLPDPQDMQEFNEMTEQAYMQDLSVPRAVAAPLVSRMLQFHNESQEIYRKNATALDNAHEILAHNNDLRYGSLVSAATTLLKIPPSKLPVTALFTVRKALTRAGFAFNIDPRSHRLTGYLQIRSKESVRMVETVREWIREWQDDMAVQTALEGDEKALRRHKPKQGAQYVYSFIEKARRIVLESRENREPTICGAVGPSKKRFPITPTSEAVRTSKTNDIFSDQDRELVRFLEAWCCSLMFRGLIRIESLPPLLLQGIGLYEKYPLGLSTGFLFLQELGTITPYENRVRFDQHLLLPSSQHSKPLQLLMSSLMEMANKHHFQDSMADLRHDWGELPVFCIDDASAQEIDDGLSVENAGNGQYWVHIHIANPTAYFSRDHPLAKMARHMGESIYMPDRTYMMLPRWATARHFSLGKNRPALTFSVKMDNEGRTLEHKIRPGFLRNVLRLTQSELRSILGEEGNEAEAKTTTVTVGGEPPPPREHRSMLDQVTPEMKDQLKVIRYLSAKRNDIREAAGGVFFDMHSPSTTVYQSHKGPGLAWDQPWRKGSRTIEGDPVISLSTQGFRNWFAATNAQSEVLVREMMLLACETAAKWCDERKIPGVFRYTVPKPDQPDPDVYLRDVMQPAAAKDPNGEYPMHLAVHYLGMIGNTALSTKPKRHKTLGMDYYGKVTSPLRRYGDMIIHWQIEAALREEARTRQSLVTNDEHADRSFLPFSAPVLDTIMLGLQPREKTILKAKYYAQHFWISQLLFRAFHYGEAALPWTPVPDSPYGPEDQRTGVAFPPSPPQNYKCRVFLQSVNLELNPLSVGCQDVELNVPMSMERPDRWGLGDVKPGDIWECIVLSVNCYRRHTIVRPLGLVHRAE